MKKAATIVAGALMVLSFAACGASAPTTTCSEYAKMDPDTGLLTAINAEQTAVLRNLLAANDLVDDDQNVMKAHIKIIAYCNIYGGAAGGNKDQPISNVL